MKIHISKATIERMDELNLTLNDNFILRAIRLMHQGKDKPMPRQDMFDQLQFTKPTKESIINDNNVSDLIFSRYNTNKISWNLILGEVIGMSAKNENNRDEMIRIFGVDFEDGYMARRLYIKEMDANILKRNAPDCGRVMARGSEHLPFSMHIKFKRNRNSAYGDRNDEGEFKININGGGCEIS